MTQGLSITLHEGIESLPEADWDACANPQGLARPRDPFTTHRFLTALERSGSVGEGTGWLPRPLVVRQGAQIIALAPLYVKGHSQGEYIFDHGWAEAFERAGGDYYPKLQVAVPFTPATGPRLLTRQGHEATGRAALLQGIEEIARSNGLSSAHITFCTEAEVQAAPAPWMARLTQQFHWQNAGYGSYEDFLATLTSRKRKALRKERQIAQSFGGEIVALSGDQLQPRHWDAFWAFYQDTGARKWGTPYLTRAFFDILHRTMAEDILLVLALRNGRPVAGALNFIGHDTLYGRYWGCTEDHPSLHFELCYHQAIDYAITHGLTRVEAGAQGEHKLARGYVPSPVHSLHLIPHAGFARAVSQYLDEERAAMEAHMAAGTEAAPFRKSLT